MLPVEVGRSFSFWVAERMCEVEPKVQWMLFIKYRAAGVLNTNRPGSDLFEPILEPVPAAIPNNHLHSRLEIHVRICHHPTHRAPAKPTTTLGFANPFQRLIQLLGFHCDGAVMESQNNVFQ